MSDDVHAESAETQRKGGQGFEFPDVIWLGPMDAYDGNTDDLPGDLEGPFVWCEDNVFGEHGVRYFLGSQEEVWNDRLRALQESARLNEQHYAEVCKNEAREKLKYYNWFLEARKRITELKERVWELEKQLEGLKND